MRNRKDGTEHPGRSKKSPVKGQTRCTMPTVRDTPGESRTRETEKSWLGTRWFCAIAGRTSAFQSSDFRRNDLARLRLLVQEERFYCLASSSILEATSMERTPLGGFPPGEQSQVCARELILRHQAGSKRSGPVVFLRVISLNTRRWKKKWMVHTTDKHYTAPR